MALLHSLFENTAGPCHGSTSLGSGTTCGVEIERIADSTNGGAGMNGSPQEPEHTHDGPPSSDPAECLGYLLSEHQEVVFRYAFRQTGCASAAEDITQEVFVRAFRALEKLRDWKAAKGWLLVIARNETARWFRKFASQVQLSEQQQAEEATNNLEVRQFESEDWVTQAMQELNPDYRIALMMYYFEELSYAEIAEQLKLPIGTVMSRLNRGRKHLKSALLAAEGSQQDHV